MLLARLLMLALLVFATTVVVTTLGSTPAFNPRLVADTVVGDGRTALSPAMYDRGAYDFQRGYAFLMADAILPGDIDAWRSSIAPVESRYRAAQARDALASAVRHDPGNAHAWAHLAWAQARLGDRAGALEAWRRSTEIAPYSGILASTRLDLVGLLSVPEEGWGALTEADLAAIARDLAVLARFDARALASRMEASPRLAALESRISLD
jgi:tetratricopeptide (TPR) repeat protein